MKISKSNKGITLVALIVTIIVLLILAGITMNFILKENGIMKYAQTAGKEYQNAQREEQVEIAKLENYIDNSRETVTISKEEYEALKPNSITADSLLMTSTDNTLTVSDLNLTNFTNTFDDNFETYFSYNTETGELTCKKDGWYCIRLQLSMASWNETYTSTNFGCTINGVNIALVRGITRGASGCEADDNNNISVFIKSGDKINFQKKTVNGESGIRNMASLYLYKI